MAQTDYVYAPKKFSWLTCLVKLCNLNGVEGVAQLAEFRVVAPAVVGSNPIALPTTIYVLSAPVAQLDRAPDFESVGRRFESCRAYQIN